MHVCAAITMYVHAANGVVLALWHMYAILVLMGECMQACCQTCMPVVSTCESERSALAHAAAPPQELSPSLASCCWWAAQQPASPTRTWLPPTSVQHCWLLLAWLQLLAAQSWTALRNYECIQAVISCIFSLVLGSLVLVSIIFVGNLLRPQTKHDALTFIGVVTIPAMSLLKASKSICVGHNCAST